MARRDKQTDAGGTQTGGAGGAQAGTTSTTAEERRADQGTQAEGRTGGNGSPAGGTAVDRARTGGRGVATRGAGANRLAGQGLTNWPVLFRAGVAASPWELVRRMSEDINQLFESLRFGDVTPGTDIGGTRTGRDTGLASRALFAPPIEVQQRDDAVVVRLDLPGVDADEIDITVEDGMLIVSGERRQEHREEREGILRTEITYGSFHRAIPLPPGAKEEEMTAQLRSGTLEVVIPISQREERGRRVQVQSS